MGKRKKAPIALLPNLDLGDRVVIGASVYELCKVKDINSEKVKIIFVRQGFLKDDHKRGTGRARVR